MLKAAVLGATGNVGQIFVQLLEGHPWFEVTTVAASERSKGRIYAEAARWRQSTPVPDTIAQMEIVDITPKEVKDRSQFIFHSTNNSLFHKRIYT